MMGDVIFCSAHSKICSLLVSILIQGDACYPLNSGWNLRESVDGYLGRYPRCAMENN